MRVLGQSKGEGIEDQRTRHAEQEELPHACIIQDRQLAKVAGDVGLQDGGGIGLVEAVPDVIDLHPRRQPKHTITGSFCPVTQLTPSHTAAAALLAVHLYPFGFLPTEEENSATWSMKERTVGS